MENKRLEGSLKAFQNFGGNGGKGGRGEDLNALARYGKYFLSAVKENQESLAAFQGVFKDEEQFSAAVRLEDLNSLAVGLLQFSLELMARSPKEQSQGGKVSKTVDEMVRVN